MRWVLILILPFIISSCELFSTRNPEKPETGATGYISPTSYEIVIENLKNSIKERNLNNYLLCFSDSSITEISEFVFNADPQILAQYLGVFSEWDIDSESKYFTSMMTNILEATHPSVSFTNIDYKNFNDSIVFTATYNLNFEFANDLSNKDYSGNTRMVLKNSKTGFWYITSWYDYQSSNNSSLSWSFLKSKYYF